mgnify:CR=1 FL=1
MHNSFGVPLCISVILRRRAAALTLPAGYAILTIVYLLSKEARHENTAAAAAAARPVPADLRHADVDRRGGDGVKEKNHKGLPWFGIPKLIPYLINCSGRNDQIVKDLKDNVEHFNLVLSDRLEHLKNLMDLLPEDLRMQAVMIDGKMQSKRGRLAREQAIENMRNGKKHFLFASYGLAKEGLDIPRLDRLYLVTPKKDYAVVIQSVGRIARTFDEKQDAICFDYVDDIQFCQNQFKRRKTHYRKAGCIL